MSYLYNRCSTATVSLRLRVLNRSVDGNCYWVLRLKDRTSTGLWSIGVYAYTIWIPMKQIRWRWPVLKHSKSILQCRCCNSFFQNFDRLNMPVLVIHSFRHPFGNIFLNGCSHNRWNSLNSFNPSSIGKPSKSTSWEKRIGFLFSSILASFYC